MFRKLKRYLRDPYYEIGYDILSKYPNMMSDKWWISTVWQMTHGYKLDWNNPITLNEKLQWLKLFDRNPLYPTLVDKIKVKEYIAKIIGKQYIVPTLAVYQSADDIKLDDLPQQFVLKCNHDSGSVVICKDKKKFDLRTAKKKLTQAQNFNYYYQSREWPYQYVKPLIFAEKYLSDDVMVDYKFYCFGQEPKYFMYSLGEAEHSVRNHKFDLKGNSIDYLFKKTSTINSDAIKLPDNLSEMIKIVELLAKSFQFLRVDLYNVNGKIYFGELTLWSAGGYIQIDSEEYAQSLADSISLDKIKL